MQCQKTKLSRSASSTSLSLHVHVMPLKKLETRKRCSVSTCVFPRPQGPNDSDELMIYPGYRRPYTITKSSYTYASMENYHNATHVSPNHPNHKHKDVPKQNACATMCLHKIYVLDKHYTQIKPLLSKKSRQLVITFISQKPRSSRNIQSKYKEAEISVCFPYNTIILSNNHCSGTALFSVSHAN